MAASVAAANARAVAPGCEEGAGERADRENRVQQAEAVSARPELERHRGCVDREVHAERADQDDDDEDHDQVGPEPPNHLRHGANVLVLAVAGLAQ